MKKPLTALSLAFCGCPTDVAHPVLQPSHHGAIRGPSALTSYAGLLVAVTDAESGRQTTVERADANGRFEFAVPAGHYALAVTSGEGFAFVEDVSSNDNPVVTLSSDCHRLHGRVTGALAYPATVAISRISRHVGDRFLAEVDRSGQIAACLPDAGYSAHVEGAITSLAVPITISADATVEFPAYASSQIQMIPSDIKLENTDLQSFSRSLVDREILGLGEANHGTGDFFTYRGRLSLELARSGKLRNILFEADAIGMMTIDDYVLGADIDVAKAVSALRFWITDVHEFLAFLANVRSYNAVAAPDAKVHVLGIDAQRLEPPVQFMLARRATLAISEREADVLSQIAPDHGKAFTSLSSNEQSALSSLLDRLIDPAGRADLATDRTRASIAARSIRYQLGYLSSLGLDGLRDQAMAELAAYIIALSGSRQTALWAHDDHVAREATGAAKSLGQYLSERFGDAYYPIAFLSYRGTARAWDAGGKIGVISHDLGPTPPFNVEAVLVNATRSLDAVWVRLDSARGPLKHWLATPRYVREFGAAYPEGDTQKLRAFPASISAVVVIPRATASTPTPTGVRKVSH